MSHGERAAGNVILLWLVLYDLRNSMAKLTPTVTPEFKQPKYGFHRYAEKLNGRAAMVGFTALVAIEYFTGRGLLSWLGLT